MKIEHVADRAAGYGMPGVRVDGNDPLAVASPLSTRRWHRARSGGGPTFIECVTFRFRGHYFGDRMPYIPKDQLAARWRPTRCHGSAASSPSGGICSEDELDRIDADAQASRRDGIAHGADRRSAVDRRTRPRRVRNPDQIPRVRNPHAMEEKEMTMREALNLALDQALQADDRVFLLGEDIADPGASGPTAGLSTKYGHDRVLDTPISEAAIVGAAIGAAIDGLLPVAEIMIMDFIGIAADQLINNAAKLRFMTAGRTTAPITVRTQVYAGLATGATHSQTLEAWFMHIPGMKVIVPSTPRDGKGLLTSAIFDEDPCLFVETIRLQSKKGPVPVDPGFPIPLGQADIKRPGTDVSLISYGRAVHDALAAAATLAGAGCQRRGGRSAHPGPARRRHHRRIRPPHPASRDRARRCPVRRAGSRDRRDPAS